MDNEQTAPTRVYTAYESVFAWLCIVLGYIFCRAFPSSRNPLGAFLVIAAFFVCFAFVLAKKRVHLTPISIAIGISSIITALSVFINTSEMLQEYAYLYSLLAFFCFVYSATGNNLVRGLSALTVIDYFKAALVMPFISIAEIFKAALVKGCKMNAKKILWAICGLLCAVIPTVIVLVLLSYDREFSRLAEDILNFSHFDVVISHVFSIIMGIPVGMYLFGLYVSSADRKCSDIITAQGCKKTAAAVRKLPCVMCVFAVIPLLFVYAIFFVSQWNYYTSGFSGVLPYELSYAEYASDGFFQLCAVATINFIVIIALALFMKRGENGKTTLSQKLLSIILSVFTLVLIATAMAKMIMYINCYGLTQKRVYASWMMAVLAVLFIFVIVKMIAKKFDAVAVGFAACVIMFAALALSGVDSFIANYNVQRYIDGKTDVVDIHSLEFNLGDSAVPALARLAKASEGKDECTYNEAVEAIEFLRIRHGKGFFSQTVPGIAAKKVFDEYSE